MQVRLYVAVALSVAIAPNLEPVQSETSIVQFIAPEITSGIALGIFVRVYFLALNFAAVTIASYIGLAAMPGVPVDTDEAQAAMPNLITLTVTALFFLTGLHALLINSIAESYEVLGVGFWLTPAALLQTYLEILQETFLLALQLSMAFLAYGVLINLGIGLANKMSPQVPVYFISMPFVISGGLILLYSMGPDLVAVFISALTSRLHAGWL